MPLTTPYNEAELISRIAQGDEQAFATLFHNYRPRVYTLALRLTGLSGISEEIVQDVFLKLWMKRASLPEIQNFPGFLVTVTQNAVYSSMRTVLRRKQKAKDYEDIVTHSFHTDTEDTLSEKEVNSIIEKAIDKLPPQQKQVYFLTKKQGFTRESVARQLQISPETVKAHLSQALRTIRAYCIVHLDIHTVLFLLLTISIK